VSRPPLDFRRPPALQATAPPEERGAARDDVRLLVSAPGRLEHRRFPELPALLSPGDLLVVNRSATVPASLPARASFGPFRLHLSTEYGAGLWVAEPRWDFDRPGPVPLDAGDAFTAAGLSGRYVASFPGIPRLAFVRLHGDVDRARRTHGAPIRYGYVPRRYPLATYQTVFAEVPGSAEMPSAGRPFSRGLLRRLAEAGVGIAAVTLHAGVSSLEVEPAARSPPVFPEPFDVPAETVARVEAARCAGGRVIAVGTTVVRALESATDGGRLRPARGFTRAYIDPARGAPVADGLLTGLHDPRTTHLAMLEAFLDRRALRAAYAGAVARGYLWHEFGDSHLILRR
jgi:S-adenosylmethionine:tRNA ribosyltransferase-isomerase